MRSGAILFRQKHLDTESRWAAEQWSKHWPNVRNRTNMTGWYCWVPSIPDTSNTRVAEHQNRAHWTASVSQGISQLGVSQSIVKHRRLGCSKGPGRISPSGKLLKLRRLERLNSSRLVMAQLWGVRNTIASSQKTSESGLDGSQLHGIMSNFLVPYELGWAELSWAALYEWCCCKT